MTKNSVSGEVCSTYASMGLKKGSEGEMRRGVYTYTLHNAKLSVFPCH